MYKDAIVIDGLKLNPRAKSWRRKIPLLRTASKKILRKIYKKYYKEKPIGFTRNELYIKVAYYFQRVALKLRHKKKRKSFWRFAKRIIKADPVQLKAVLRGSIFEINSDERGGDNMSKKSLRKRAGVSGKKRKLDKSKERISSIVYRLIKAGEKDKAIIKAVKKVHPDSKINSIHMNWYRAQVANKKKGTSAVKKIKAKKKKAKDEDEEEDEDEDEEDEDEDEDDDDDEDEDDE